MATRQCVAGGGLTLSRVGLRRCANQSRLTPEMSVAVRAILCFGGFRGPVRGQGGSSCRRWRAGVRSCVTACGHVCDHVPVRGEAGRGHVDPLCLQRDHRGAGGRELWAPRLEHVWVCRGLVRSRPERCGLFVTCLGPWPTSL